MIGNLEDNTKPFWRYINSRKGNSQTIQTLQSNENKITTQQEIDTLLNSQFERVFTIEGQNNCAYIS